MEYNNTIEVWAKEWFDKVNGNSYFSARVWLDDELIAVIPFEYGYGSYYEDAALQAIEEKLKDLGANFDGYNSLWRICDENNIKLTSHKNEKCLKREVVAHGTL